MFSHLSYDALREKLPLCSRAFSEVYDKVGGTARVAPVTYKKIKETN
jgi:delta24-sterol reductase